VNPPPQVFRLDPDSVKQIYTFVDRPLSPVKAMANPFAEGVELYFREGFAFRVSSLGAPIITWREGSAGDGVPAPASDFHLISFRDAQPPVLLSYPGKPLPLKVTGEPGNWVVRSGAPFEGWVRVIAPFGREIRNGADASQLGAMSEAIVPHLSRWTALAPELLGITADVDGNGLVGRWRFDRAAAVLPPILVAAVRGELGRKATLLSPATIAFPGGPSVTKDTELVLRFPDAVWRPGRALGSEPPAIALDPTSVPSITNNAFVNLMGRRRVGDRERALKALSEFEKTLPNGWRWYGDGRTAGEMGAWALLSQVVSPGSRSDWLARLRDSVSLGTGWPDMRGSEDDQRRGAALGSLCLGLAADAPNRLAGVLMDLALRQREVTGGLQVMPSARKGMYGGRGSIFAYPYRVMGPQTVVARAAEGQLRLFADTPREEEEVRLFSPMNVGPTRGTLFDIGPTGAGLREWRWRRGVGAAPKMSVLLAPFTQPLPDTPKYEELPG
jgi:hypothetical protein